MYLQLKQSMTYKLNDEDIAETVNYGSAVLMLDSKKHGNRTAWHNHIASNSGPFQYALNGRNIPTAWMIRIPNGYTYEIA